MICIVEKVLRYRVYLLKVEDVFLFMKKKSSHMKVNGGLFAFTFVMMVPINTAIKLRLSMLLIKDVLRGFGEKIVDCK
jgi:hypothetical protein